jgi:uncharacterized protein (TIGR02118 family)
MEADEELALRAEKSIMCFLLNGRKRALCSSSLWYCIERMDRLRRSFEPISSRSTSYLPKKIPGLRRYKQNFVLPDSKRERPEWDCVVELYFDNQEAMEAAWNSPEGQAATADLDIFADLSRTAWSVVEERVVVR